MITGGDALSYVQGQVSQDTTHLGDGDSAYTFVLQPNGKVEALARVTRLTERSLLIDTDIAFGDSLRTRLDRFKIRVDVDIVAISLPVLAIRGVAQRPDGAVSAWASDGAFDLIGDDLQPPAGLREGTLAELELARIEAGWPAMGTEITEATIPAETGVVQFAVSFTKGCYPGQELVERMDSRGSQAPRFVRRLHGAGAATAGTEVRHDGKVVGMLTSLAATAGGWVALASIARSVQPGDVVVVADADSVVEPTFGG